MSSVRVSRNRSPSRTTSWSSSRYTRIVGVLMGSFLPRLRGRGRGEQNQGGQAPRPGPPAEEQQREVECDDSGPADPRPASSGEQQQTEDQLSGGEGETPER